MIVRKWNWKSHRYEDIEISDNWRCPVYTSNLNEVVNCTSCGRELPFGSSYTSLEIHTNYGMGYPVCGDCFDIERYNRDSNKEN